MNKAFGRVTENLAKVEAKAVQNIRQLVEMRPEMAQQTAEVSTLRNNIRTLTAEVQTMRLEASSSRTPPPPAGASHAPWSTAGARPAPKVYDIHTPLPSYSQERAVLFIWPRKIIPDNYKLMHRDILSRHLLDGELDPAEPNFLGAPTATVSHSPTGRRR